MNRTPKDLDAAWLKKIRRDYEVKRKKKLLEHYMQIVRTVGIIITLGLQAFVVYHLTHEDARERPLDPQLDSGYVIINKSPPRPYSVDPRGISEGLYKCVWCGKRKYPHKRHKCHGT